MTAIRDSVMAHVKAVDAPIEFAEASIPLRHFTRPLLKTESMISILREPSVFTDRAGERWRVHLCEALKGRTLGRGKINP